MACAGYPRPRPITGGFLVTGSATAHWWLAHPLAILARVQPRRFSLRPSLADLPVTSMRMKSLAQFIHSPLFQEGTPLKGTFFNCRKSNFQGSKGHVPAHTRTWGFLFLRNAREERLSCRITNESTGQTRTQARPQSSPERKSSKPAAVGLGEPRTYKFSTFSRSSPDKFSRASFW